MGAVLRGVRSFLVFLFMAVTVIPIASVLIVSSFLMPYRVTYFWIGRPWLRMAIWATRVIGGIQYRVRGYENLLAAAESNRVIIGSKHQSTWETFFFPALMTHPVAYVYKQSLRWVPFFGWAIGRLHMVPIDRSAKGDAWEKVARIGARLMDEGKWIIMFPEGTRAPRGDQLLYKTGAARLALATDAVIVPVAVCSGRCWPRKTWTFIPGEAEVVFGEAIKPTSEDDAMALMARVEAWVEAEMREIDADAYGTD